MKLDHRFNRRKDVAKDLLKMSQAASEPAEAAKLREELLGRNSVCFKSMEKGRLVDQPAYISGASATMAGKFFGSDAVIEVQQHFAQIEYNGWQNHGSGWRSGRLYSKGLRPSI